MGMISLLSFLAPMLSHLIEGWFKDPIALANAKNQLQELLNIAEQQHLEYQKSQEKQATITAQANVVMTQMNGNAMQRDWIPVLMYMCIFIVASAMIFTPILHFFIPSIQVMIVPDHVWSLIDICLGGGIGIHGVNKIANTVFNDDKFFRSIRSRLGKLNQQQVDALNAAITDAEKSE